MKFVMEQLNKGKGAINSHNAVVGKKKGDNRRRRKVTIDFFSLREMEERGRIKLNFR